MDQRVKRQDSISTRPSSSAKRMAADAPGLRPCLRGGSRGFGLGQTQPAEAMAIEEAGRDGYPVIAASGSSRSSGGEDRAGENEQRQEKQKQLDVHGGVTSL